MRYAFVIAALVLCAACRDEHVTQQTVPSASTTMPPSDTAMQTSPMNAPIPRQTDNPAATPSAAVPTQEVHLIEYSIHLPESVPAGRVAFNIENGGKEDHGFVIEGNGVEQKTKTLARGDSAALEVDLKPGTYTVYCPVDGHRGKGMSTTLIVK